MMGTGTAAVRKRNPVYPANAHSDNQNPACLQRSLTLRNASSRLVLDYRFVEVPNGSWKFPDTQPVSWFEQSERIEVRKAYRIWLSFATTLAITCALACHQNKVEAPSPTPTGNAKTGTDIQNTVVHDRAVEAVIWGMPAVNYDRMYQAMVSQTHGSYNQIVYWSKLPSWKNQLLTPNPDSIYVMPFFNTREAGPMVLEIPARG